MLRVLLTTCCPNWPIARQTPRRAGVWEDFEFVIDQTDVTCHAWVCYLTEKISDAFFGSAFPFYFGHATADDYFPSGSYEPIDVLRPDEATNHICHCIEQRLDIERTQQVEQARRFVLDEINMFPTLVRLLQEKMVDGPQRNIRLYSKSQHV